MKTVQTEPDSPLLDYDWLVECCLGNLPLVRRLLVRYADIGQQDCERLVAAQQAKDFRSVAAIAHRIKGSAAAIGSKRMSELAAVVEREVGLLDEQGLKTKIQEICEVQAELSEHCRRSADVEQRLIASGSET